MRALTFSGILLDSGELMLEPGFVVDGEIRDEKGELRVEILAGNGELIATTSVPLTMPCINPGGSRNEERPMRMATGLVKFPAGASRLLVRLEDRILLEQAKPASTNRLKVVWPRALTGSAVSVHWVSSHKPAMAALGYSNDDGKTWSPLSLPTPSDMISFDATTLPGGPTCFLELTVTDGFQTARARSPRFATEPKGWVLWIFSPASGSVLPSAEPVLLAAQAYHLEERRASFDEIVWTSSLDGGLGRGAQVAAVLSAGQQIITATMGEVSSQVEISLSE